MDKKSELTAESAAPAETTEWVKPELVMLSGGMGNVEGNPTGSTNDFYMQRTS